MSSLLTKNEDAMTLELPLVVMMQPNEERDLLFSPHGQTPCLFTTIAMETLLLADVMVFSGVSGWVGEGDWTFLTFNRKRIITLPLIVNNLLLSVTRRRSGGGGGGGGR